MLCLGVVTVPRSNQPPSAPPAANSVRATLDGWRAEVIAEVEAEIAKDDSAPNSCANPVNYARNQARQQQAEEAERGQHREKQLAGAACFLNVREGRPTTYEDVKHYLRRMSRSAGGESEHYPQSLRTLSKNEAWLSAEDELVWARERFRADCAARAIRTCEDAEWHYTRIRDARAAVVRAECISMYIE